MSLPASRSTTYAASSPVKSADLNDMQDCIVAGKHGDITLCVPGVGASSLGGGSADWEPSGVPGSMISVAAGTLWIPLPLRTGDRVKSLAVARLGTGGVDSLEIKIVRLTAAGVAFDIGGTGAFDPGAAWADSNIDPADYTLVAGESVFIAIIAGGAGCAIGSTRVLYDRP